MFFIDLHVHTLASAHAYSTVYENINVAVIKQLELIAITDHGPQLNDSPHFWHFMNMQCIPEKVHGVRILKGIEANILDLAGNIDCTNEMSLKLDFVMAGFHPPLFMPADIEQNTIAMINVIKNPLVNIISHPDNPLYPVYFEDIAKAAYENDVALEVNSGSLSARPGSEKICPDMIKAVKKYGGHLSLGSDAHFCWNIGELGYCETLLDECNFNRNQVLNTSVSNVLNFINGKKLKHHC